VFGDCQFTNLCPVTFPQLLFLSEDQGDLPRKAAMNLFLCVLTGLSYRPAADAPLLRFDEPVKHHWPYSFFIAHPIALSCTVTA
jgi:hypothetical protein